MYANRQALTLHLLRVKFALVFPITPAMAWAGDSAMQTAVRHGSVEAVTLLQWGFIVGFSMLGWVVSELDQVAELWNLEGRSKYEVWKERLKLLKGLAAANAAGIMVYFLGGAAPSFLLRMLGLDPAIAGPGGANAQFPDMVLFVFVAGAGYMGARWFNWLERKFFGGTQ